MPFDAGVDGVTEGVIAGVNAIPLAPSLRELSPKVTEGVALL